MEPTATQIHDLNCPALKIKEVAAILQLKEGTVYELAQAGKFPGAFKFGNSWRIHGPTVLACMVSGQAPSQSKRRAK